MIAVGTSLPKPAVPEISAGEGKANAYPILKAGPHEVDLSVNADLFPIFLTFIHKRNINISRQWSGGMCGGPVAGAHLSL